MPSKSKLHQFTTEIILVASGNSSGDTATGQKSSQAASFQYHV